MANLGHYVDRNPDLRAAGLSSIRSTAEVYGVKECCVSLDKGEEAEHQILAHCRRLKPKPYGKRRPKHPVNNIDDLLIPTHRKKPFAGLQMKARISSFARRPVLGQAMATYSKPDTVNNLSRTFGKASEPEESLYSVMMPPKTAEEVNREYAEFHDKHIISHNHYFPSEQINRSYTQPFNRFDTFGIPAVSDPSGIKVKRCLDEGEEHLKIVKKPQKDVDDRTKAPLGKKFIWYPYQIPENMTFGRVYPHGFDVRSLLENTSPCPRTLKLTSAISHLSHLRDLLQRREDFNMNQLITALAKKDTTGIRQLSLAQIIETMKKMNIPADSERIRTAASHFRLFVDEDSCEELVKYEELCNLLYMIKPLPQIGSITPEPEMIYNKITTYRQLCADLDKKSDEVICTIQPHKKPIQEDMDNTRLKDVITPDAAVLSGLWPSDFKKLRAKDEVERVFQKLVPKDDFERIWQGVIDKEKDPKEMASIEQFRAEMIRFEVEKKGEAKEKPITSHEE